MMNQLLLAQVLAEGFSWDYLWHWTHDQDLGKVLISAIAPIATAAIAALSLILTARRETKQMELSKQAIPPELTRYKTWVEISEKCIELTKFEKNNNFENNNFEDSEEEYLEIRASRKAALKRAVWERKVISVCPSAFLQKRLLAISPRVITDKNFNIYNFTYSHSRRSLKAFDIFLTAAVVLYIFWLIYAAIDFLGIEWEVATNPFAKNNWLILGLRAIPVLIILIGLFFLDLAIKAQFEAVKDEYYIRTLVIEERGSIGISQLLEMNAVKNRLRLAAMSRDVDFIYLPWGEGVRCSAIKRVWSVIHPMHYVKKGLNGRSDVIWGSYKKEDLNGDLKENIKLKKKLRETLAELLKKLGRKNTQAPNSEIQEESPPTHPQG